MKSHYRKRYIPSALVRAQMDAADRRFEAEQRAKFPDLFPGHDDPDAPLVIRSVDLVPKPGPRGAVVNLTMQPAETVPGCRVCLLARGAIVELIDLVCPTCGQDYRERAK